MASQKLVPSTESKVFKTSPFFLSSKLIYAGDKEMWVVVDWNKSNKSNQLTTKFSNSASALMYGHLYLCIVFGSFPPNCLEREWCCWGGTYANMRVPRGNVEIGKKGGANQAPPFCSTLSQQPPQTCQKNQCCKSLGDSGERMPSACPVRPITFSPSRYESMAVRGGFKQCRREPCKEGYIWIYCLIVMTYHGSVDDVIHNRSCGTMKRTCKWWAIPWQLQRVDKGGGLRGCPPGQRRHRSRRHKWASRRLHVVLRWSGWWFAEAGGKISCYCYF